MRDDGGKPQNLRVTWTARRLENLNSTRSPSRFALDIPPSPPPPVERACSRPDGRPQSRPWSLDPPPRRGTAAAWIIAKCRDERDRGGGTEAEDRRTRWRGRTFFSKRAGSLPRGRGALHSFLSRGNLILVCDFWPVFVTALLLCGKCSLSVPPIHSRSSSIISIFHPLLGLK